MSQVTLSHKATSQSFASLCEIHISLRMGAKHWAVAGGLLLLAVATKAHMIFIRMAILAAAGLAGLYLMHILATDYRKIQAARPKLLGGLFKRSVDDQFFGADIDSQYSAAQMKLEEAKKAGLLQENQSNLSLLRVASVLDPQGCARRYICSISTKPKETLSVIESAMLELIQKSGKDGTPFREAARLGKKLGDTKGCSAAFPRCTYSVTEMLRIIQPIY